MLPLSPLIIIGALLLSLIQEQLRLGFSCGKGILLKREQKCFSVLLMPLAEGNVLSKLGMSGMSPGVR